MEELLPYALVVVGATEGWMVTAKFVREDYAGLGAVIGAHFYVLSKDAWVRQHGVYGSYLWIIFIMLWIRALLVR